MIVATKMWQAPGMFKLLTTVAFLFLFSLNAHAQGGPPMVTDDPGTPGDGHWEINFARLSASTSSLSTVQFPYLDINYGWGPRIQLKLEGGWVTSGSLGYLGLTGEQSGASTALLGVKYRFLDEEADGVSVSMYPQIQFHHFFSSNDPEIAQPGRQYILPFEASKSFGSWEINPEVGYLYGVSTSDELLAGVVIAYEKAKPFEPMAEVHVNTHLDGAGSTVLVNFGLRYAANENLNVIFSVGHTVVEANDEEPELDSYLGLQFEI